MPGVKVLRPCISSAASVEIMRLTSVLSIVPCERPVMHKASNAKPVNQILIIEECFLSC